MSLLEIKGLTHRFEEQPLFENANLSINKGEHIGIVGLNGAGKSTFMNILCGIIPQDAGELKWTNNVKWGYLDQHATVDKNLSVMDYLRLTYSDLFKKNEQLEEIYLKMGQTADLELLDKLINQSNNLLEYLTNKNFFEIDSEIKKVANGLGVNNFGYDTVIGTLSGGQRAKLMLAKLLLEDLDVMLLDEPTNFLDIMHIDWLIKYLNAFKGTFLVISHDTAFLSAITGFIINLENRQIKKYSGNYDQFLLQREQNAKQYEDNFNSQMRSIKKMEDYIAKNSARAATAGMANSRKKMLDKIEVLAKPIVSVKPVFSFPYVICSAKDMLVVKNLEVGYSGKTILKNINMHMGSQTKLWIRGTNGIGKSTILKTLMKKIPQISGTFEFNINSKISYLEQDLEFKNTNITALVYMSDVFPKINQKDLRTKLASVGIKGELATKSISNLSGGEQVRIKLCGLMYRDSNILILDEPTNHLDISAKESLLEALQAYEGALILVTHEPHFANKLCNEVWDLDS